MPCYIQIPHDINRFSVCFYFTCDCVEACSVRQRIVPTPFDAIAVHNKMKHGIETPIMYILSLVVGNWQSATKCDNPSHIVTSTELNSTLHTEISKCCQTIRHLMINWLQGQLLNFEKKTYFQQNAAGLFPRIRWNWNSISVKCIQQLIHENRLQYN